MNDAPIGLGEILHDPDFGLTREFVEGLDQELDEIRRSLRVNVPMPSIKVRVRQLCDAVTHTGTMIGGELNKLLSRKWASDWEGDHPRLLWGAFRPNDDVLDEQQAKHLKAAFRQLVRFVVEGTNEHFLRKIGENLGDAIDDYLSTRGYEAVGHRTSNDNRLSAESTALDGELPIKLPHAPKIMRPVMEEWPRLIRVLDLDRVLSLLDEPRVSKGRLLHVLKHLAVALIKARQGNDPVDPLTIIDVPDELRPDERALLTALLNHSHPQKLAGNVSGGFAPPDWEAIRNNAAARWQRLDTLVLALRLFDAWTIPFVDWQYARDDFWPLVGFSAPLALHVPKDAGRRPLDSAKAWQAWIALEELREFYYRIAGDVQADWSYSTLPDPIHELVAHPSSESAWAAKVFVESVVSRHCGTALPMTAAIGRPKGKRSTAKGEARTKIIARLTKYHDYSDGGCLHCDPIGVNELARLEDVSPSTVSKFFDDEFGGPDHSDVSGHQKYRSICCDASKLADSLKALNDEFSPFDLYGREPRDELNGEDDE